MKFLLTLLLTTASILFFCSCSGPKVMVNGIEYEALTEDEMKKLCYLAELYLKNNVPNLISQKEANMLTRFAPEFQIKYYGDRTGKAIVKWIFPQRSVEVVFEGELLETSAKCWAQVEVKQPDTIDFTKKRTSKKQSTAEKSVKRSKKRSGR